MVSYIIEIELCIDHECLKEEKEDNWREGRVQRAVADGSREGWLVEKRMRRLDKLGDYSGRVEEG